MTAKYKQTRRRFPAVAVILIIALALGIAAYYGYDRFLHETHPIKYESYVRRYAAENGLDTDLVYAVIKTESGFDPTAVSNVGARGLMQIMEETFDWLKFKMGDEETKYSEMFDPKTNIKFGCYLLGYLCNEFGSVETAVAAYHAGRGKVNEWLADKSISSDGKNLDTIPIKDTAHYVSKIVSAIEIYKRLYD